ncbi:hypothetical protein BB561_000189 [Smittium simulii]|uniref:Uncharacterized protein n=1 Tax=Smittium simulii TaxID=133385 RepID=A0A2T9Z044_9FUNG|nr:hypothetical protein BB561_000189 [Smittium simulii]
MIYNFKEDSFIVLEFEKYKTTAQLGTVEINQSIRSLAYKKVLNPNDESAKSAAMILDSVSELENSTEIAIKDTTIFPDTTKENSVNDDKPIPNPSINDKASNNETIKSEDIYYFENSLPEGSIENNYEPIPLFNDNFVYDWDIFHQFWYI